MPLAVDTLSLGSIGTNCYLVRSGLTATDAAVIDPGAEADRILAALDRAGARCGAILLTHSHFDHIGALAELAAQTGAPVWLPEAEEDVFARPDAYFGTFGVSIRGFAGPSTLLAGGETIDAVGIAFEVTHVPGHSPGHVAYYAEGALFSGDVLFSGSVGRVDLPGGDWESLLTSIRSLAEAYPPETVVHSGHGPATTLGAELARNPFLAELRARGVGSTEPPGAQVPTSPAPERE
jgi:hydroxyacylglutathione hydrolase